MSVFPCPDCGNQVSLKAELCGKCGRLLDSVEPPSTPYPSLDATCQASRLTPKQLRILKCLKVEGGWTRRQQMEERAGRKGFSAALGAPTREIKTGTLEQLGYVERRDMTTPFEYRITKLGERALEEYEREHGEVPLLSAVAQSPGEDDL